MDEIMSQVGDINMMSAKQTMPISMLKDITKTGDTFKLSYNMDAVQDFAMKIVKEATQASLLDAETKEEAAAITEEETAAMTAAMSNFDFQFNDTVIEVSMPNDTLSSMKANLSGQLTVEGMTLDLAMDLDYTINAQGDAVVLTFPEDLATYQDVSSAMIEMSADDMISPEP